MKITLRGFLSATVIAIAPLIYLAFGAPPLYADLYKWEDARGVLHLTDDLGKVPEAKRHKVKTFKIKPHKRRVENAPIHIPPTKAVKKQPKLYGEHTLEWWKAAFHKLNEEMDTLKDEIEKKTQFINVFEGGRRFGQLFGEAEVANYKRYKEEITKDEENLKEMEDKLEKLRKNARIEDVPREVFSE